MFQLQAEHRHAAGLIDLLFKGRVICFYSCFAIQAGKGSPTVAKSRTPYLKSHLKSLKSLKFQNLKSKKVETVISKFLYISASNHVKIGMTISNKLLVKVTNHETS